MSLFALASLKGAPGVTTLACLVAATWPLDRRVVVAECDPFGGDLAARFELSTQRGCLSLATAARRDPEAVVADPHIQRLPGGLEVLVGGSSSEMALAQSVTRADVNQAVIAAARSVDVVADLGRMAAPYEECRQLLQAAEAVGVVIGPDQPAVAHAAEQGEMLRRLCGDRISLMIVGRGTSRSRDIEAATGLRVSAAVPRVRPPRPWPRGIRAELAAWPGRSSSSPPAVSPIRSHRSMRMTLIALVNGHVPKRRSAPPVNRASGPGPSRPTRPPTPKPDHGSMSRKRRRP